jgi:phosphate transport system substrate-binding protein
MQTDGAIGYTEYGYARQQNISTAILQNKSGQFVAPSSQAAAKSLQAVKLPENLRAFILDPTGADSYPIVTYTWILAYKKYDDPGKLQAFKGVMNWALTDGQKLSEELGYVPLAPSVVQRVQAAVNTIQ